MTEIPNPDGTGMIEAENVTLEDKHRWQQRGCSVCGTSIERGFTFSDDGSILCFDCFEEDRQ